MPEATSHEIVIKRCPEAVSEVRDFVRLAVGHWGHDDYVPCLVACELATNAIRHSGIAPDDDLTVRLALTDDGSLWLEVQDPDPAPPLPRRAEESDESGRGLLIVERLTRHWGVRPLADRSGKVVFAVLDP